MLKDTMKKIKYRVRNRLVLSLIFERLAAIGLIIRPYYLTQEFLFDEIGLNLKPELAPLEADFLSSSEIKQIYDHPESKWWRRDNKKVFEEGRRCFALKYNEEIMTYLWCNLIKCHELNPFPLKEDEAYLSGAFTFRAYRGKNLAPFLRYQLYKHLNQIGRTKIYSLTDVFNTPAIKFKKKLKAKPLKIIINIMFFNKYNWNFAIGSPKHFVITI
jgi:RimJ/RimL family protein N-acetyltransferase